MPRLIIGLLVVMAGAPAIAGAAVGQSIWKQEQAYQRAIKSKPADAKVTGSHCHANYMGMDTGLDLHGDVGLTDKAAALAYSKLFVLAQFTLVVREPRRPAG